MTSAAKPRKSPQSTHAATVIEATVTRVDAKRTPWVALSNRTKKPAKIAVVGQYEPRVGDVVLIAVGARDAIYVIGVVKALREINAVRTSDGTNVSIKGLSGEEQLEVRDASGRLLFEHRVGERKTILHTPPGDLEIRADDGHIDLVAGRSLRLHAEEGVEIRGDRMVSMATAATATRPASSVKLDAHGVAIATSAIDARAHSAAVSLNEGRIVVKQLSTAVEKLQQVVGVMETQATRIIERAKNVYRDVEDLSQTRAGRMRLVAEATFHLLGKRTLFKAEEDVSIKGERIYLA